MMHKIRIQVPNTSAMWMLSLVVVIVVSAVAAVYFATSG